MRDENKTQRQAQIETAAYALLEEKGYAGTSMQGIARAAKASNETLYKWYGDKLGLFQALVARNAQDLRGDLDAALQSNVDALSILKAIGPKLLLLLTGDRAVALNRAAAADSTGTLGAALSRAGRETILPLLHAVLERARKDHQLAFADVEEAGDLFLDLLVGDQQIRRVIGRLPAPAQPACEARTQRAIQHLCALLAP